MQIAIKVLMSPPDIKDMYIPDEMFPEVVQIVNNESFNPTLRSPNAIEELNFLQTRDGMNIEIYRTFLDNAIAGFRHSKLYKQYKNYLYELGLNRCQVLGITSDMAEVEMHHNFLTIYDIAYMICEHVLNTEGQINTFRLIKLLKEVHRRNLVPIVMLSKTAHQMFHNNREFVLPGPMCFGFWMEFIRIFNRGISTDIANKIIYYINDSLEYKNSNYEMIPDNDLLTVRKFVLDWSQYNEYSSSLSTNQFITGTNYTDYNNYFIGQTY